MSIQPAPLEIERRHVKALVDLLDQQAGEFLSEASAESDSWRLYFVDADVLSIFVNGTTRDPVNDWSSLLSLTAEPGRREREASQAAASLANVLGQAVVRYLFGAFRKSAEIQRRRIYITPEHEREFKAIVHALLHRQARAESGWLDKLRDCYLDLAKRNGHADAGNSSAREIVELLEVHANGGAEDRAFTLLRDAITPLAAHILAPPSAESRSVLFSTSDASYRRLVIESRQSVWDAFSSSMLRNVRGIEDFLLLKRVIFEADGGSGDGEMDLPRPFSFYRTKAMQWLATREAPVSIQTRRDIESQIAIAARQASDLMAIARIDAMGHWLSEHHPATTGKNWEPVLISGSNMLPNLLEHWSKNSKPATIRHMHPLALLRRVDLWDPAGTRRLRDEDYLDQPHEFALSLIFRNSSGSVNAATENVEAFTFSLRAQLDLVVAREAEVGDRGLARLRRMLETSEAFDRKVYQEAVRDLVATRFVQTYRHLTELFPGTSHQLPASSLPTLDLPHSKSAMSFMANVRDTMVRRRPLTLASEELDDSIKQDPTGYSALLASAIGYMARGSSWLPAAQTMSATAVLLAKGRGDTRYPEGNEALYLEAFLQRMTLRLADDVEKFRHTHIEMIGEAQRTLHHWAAIEEDVASECVGADSRTPSRLAWIDYRYRLEANAREVFVAMHGVLRGKSMDLDWGQLSETAQASLRLHREGVVLIGLIESWDRLMRPSIWFCGIQAGMSLLQLWLCWRQVKVVQEAGACVEAFEDFEADLEPIVSGWWTHKDELGKLLPLLAAIYARDTDRARAWRQFKVDERQFNVSFAAIDRERFGWLRDLWRNNGANRASKGRTNQRHP